MSDDRGIALVVGIVPSRKPTPKAVAEEITEEIVVIGRRARGVRWDWHVNKAGRLTKCKITRSSGDSQIDQIGCEATRLCAARGARRERQMEACIIPLRQQLIRALAERRAAEN